jgi:pantoate--beta-alanine ligase
VSIPVLRTARELRALQHLPGGRPLVFVPTMGALHEGHLALARRGAELGEVVVSIFVNPAQFGPGEDYAKYPRNLGRDLELLAPCGVKAVFTPAVETMYGREVGVTVQPGPRAADLCGGSRPGHFAGVLTVVAKLFNLVRPDIAIFGRKDAQQCLVIAEMVDDLKFPVRLLDHPTVREADGLAMSSRNAYLGDDDRQRALCLSRALGAAREALAGGERDPEALRRLMLAALAPADSVDYAEVRRVPDLARTDVVAGRLLLAVAANVGPARLIDNLVLQVDPAGVRETSLLEDAC